MEELIERIKALFIYRATSYYTSHLDLPLWRIFSGSIWNGVPSYLKSICVETKRLIKEHRLSQEEIVQFIANDIDNPSYFYVSQCILLYGTNESLSDEERYSIASKEASLPSNVILDEEIISCVVACFVLDMNRYKDWDFEIIVPEEQFAYPVTDYKLVNVKGVDFRQSGFIFDDKFYLYNKFINRKSLEFTDKMPGVFQLITDNIDLTNADFYLRLDERLAVPAVDAEIFQRMVFEKFRGALFSFSTTKLEKMKNIIVHFDSETYDKLLMVVKRDYDSVLNEEFWHIEIEELPYIDKKEHVGHIITTFIHGKYYPKRQVFLHMDFIKNQYPIEEYCTKQDDRSKEDIQIDYYTTKECHYKIWCIENINISEELWYKLAYISLSELYRPLFNEMLEFDEMSR